MHGGKNWILPKYVDQCKPVLLGLIGWKSGKTTFFPGGSVAMDSVYITVFYKIITVKYQL
jgi:hypothetical protein